MQDDVFSSPAIFNDTIYIGSRDNHVYALDRTLPALQRPLLAPTCFVPVTRYSSAS